MLGRLFSKDTRGASGIRLPSGIAALLPLLSRLFFKILSVQNVPFPAPRRNVTGERKNFLPNHTVDLVLAMEEFMDDLLGLGQRAAFVREACQVVFLNPFENQMSQMRNPALR